MRQVASIGPLHFIFTVMVAGAYQGRWYICLFFCVIFLTSKGWGRDLAGVSFVMSALVFESLRVERGSSSQAAHRYPGQGTRR
jgi:hypothetical protein